MSDETNSEFDPRFDPAFQRGFDSSIPVKESVPAPAAPPLAQPVPVEPALPPAPAPKATTPPRAVVPEPVPVAEPEDIDAPVFEDSAQLLPETVETRSARNPFLVVLLVIGVVLIVAGLVLFGEFRSAFNSSEVPSQGDYNALLSEINVAPFVSLLGVAIVVALLFVFALGWRKRG